MTQNGFESLDSAPLAPAKAQAALLPDLLAQAKRIAHTIMAGWHGRRRPGPGDVFWQFRAYDQSESATRIDWRRSARDDSLTVRDQEWQAALTFWLWADNSPSMAFASKDAKAGKQAHALIIVLALAEILARGGERIGWPGLTRAFASRQGCERIAERLRLDRPSPPLPPLDAIKSRSDLILASDFCEPLEHIENMIHVLARRGVRGFLIHVIDPAEEDFPYTGRTEFQDPEGGSSLTFGRAQSVRGDYATLFKDHARAVKDLCRKSGWFYMSHRTDRGVQDVLAAIHALLRGNRA